jgi:transposase
MLAWESVVEAKALRARGWSISAIARHLQINRRTVRRYLSDEATVGVRRPAGPDGFELFAGYARQRLVDDPHLWATALQQVGDRAADWADPDNHRARARHPLGVAVSQQPAFPARPAGSVRAGAGCGGRPKGGSRSAGLSVAH